MKIKQIELQTSLVYELKEFYTQILGFPLIESDADTYFSCQTGSSVLGFRKGASQAACYHFAFNIAENQLDVALAWLKHRNIQCCSFNEKEVIDFPNWNAHALYFLDPAGNVVEFIARHDLENTTTEEPFTTHQILEISEIGLPVTNIKTFYQSLQAALQIPIYSQISNLKSFCAAGDAQGLFILVPLERNWFPTEVKNGIYPTKIWIESEQDSVFELGGLPYQITALRQDRPQTK